MQWVFYAEVIKISDVILFENMSQFDKQIRCLQLLFMITI